MRKKIVLILMVIFSSFLLVGCGFQLIAEREVINYVSSSDHETLRINMINDVEKSVIAVKTETGHGSGIIYRSEAIADNTEYMRYYALTNHHVVEDGGEMKVHFGDPALDIAVVDYASNETYDIAVVRFVAPITRVIPVHEITQLIVNPDLPNDYKEVEIVKGQDVYAIGTPDDILRFNYATDGIVSLTSYPYNGIDGLALMHSAELNPGNSGGPLFNLNGDVIGINVAKIPSISTSEGIIAAEGLNYALSMNTIAPIIRGFDSFTPVIRKPRLGITVQDVSVFLQTNDDELLPPNAVGIVVIDLDPTRNAKDVLKKYDLVTKVNGTTVTAVSEMGALLAEGQFGDTFSITVIRKVNGSFVELNFDIKLS